MDDWRLQMLLHDVADFDGELSTYSGREREGGRKREGASEREGGGERASL